MAVVIPRADIVMLLRLRGAELADGCDRRCRQHGTPGQGADMWMMAKAVSNV